MAVAREPGSVRRPAADGSASPRRQTGRTGQPTRGVRQAPGAGGSAGFGRRAPRRSAPRRRVPLHRRAFVPVLLGLGWGVLLLAAVNISPLALACVLIPAACLASLSIARSVPVRRAGGEPRRRAAREPDAETSVLGLGVGAAVVCPLVALAGPIPAFASTVVALVVGALVLQRAEASWRASAELGFAVCLPAIAAAAVVASAVQGANEGFALVAALCAYDLGSFLMGNARSATGGLPGIAGGVLSVAVVAIAVAAALDPPFSGARPWVLFGMVAVAAPAGVRLVELLVGPRRRPAVRRLDSFVLAAPAWVAAVAIVLHR